jgi:hypothetical protein
MSDSTKTTTSSERRIRRRARKLGYRIRTNADGSYRLLRYDMSIFWHATLNDIRNFLSPGKYTKTGEINK